MKKGFLVREFISLGYGNKLIKLSYCWRLILNVRKKTDGYNIDLDETELSLLVGRVPSERYGLSCKIVMDLRCVKILNA